MPFWIARFSPAGIILFLAGTLHAQLLNVDFNNNSYGATHGDPGPNPGPTMSGAALLGNTGDLWNGISAGSGSGIALTNADGTASTVTLTFTSGGGYDINNFAGTYPFAKTTYAALMEDYLYSVGAAQTITLSGLAPDTAYNLVLYNAADTAAAGRVTSFTVNGATRSSTWNGTSSNLVSGIDYVAFTPAVSDGSGNLIITYSGSGSLEGDINGFQIQFVAASLAAQTPNSAYTWTTLAGSPSVGAADGVGSKVKFNDPNGVAADANGNVYVTDTENETIRKITAAGVSSTIAGFAGATGTNDGIGSNARFNTPTGITADSAGNLYVADYGNNTIRKITPSGTNWIVSTIAGSPQLPAGAVDGNGATAQFNSPTDVAVDLGGNVYVADLINSTIRQIKPVGTNWTVSTIAGSASYLGTNDGPGNVALFAFPAGVAVDASTNLYVSDSGGKTIRKLVLTGTTWTVSTLAGSPNNSGTTDGTGGNARFGSPQGLAVDASGNIYVADESDTIRKVTAGGTVTTLAGVPNADASADGTGSGAEFNRPIGLTLDNAGNIYVADSNNQEIRKVSTAGLVRTLAGQAVSTGSTDGTGTDARFNRPFGLALDGSGNLYVADAGNDTIREVSPAGVVSTLAGLAQVAGTNDGVGNNARFRNPAGLAFSGSFYVADSQNQTIRLLSSAGTVSTILGAPQSPGSLDGSGGAARFYAPQAIYAGSSGIFVADSVNNTIRRITSRIRIGIGGTFTTTWTVTTLAGSPSNPIGGNDGMNGAAQFYDPSGIVADAAGNVYVGDSGNATIRELTLQGTNWVVTTIAGQTQNYGNVDGIGTNALFNSPNGMAIDGAGNLYVADFGNSTIRKMTPVAGTWIVSTIGGQAGNFGSTDGAGTAALFSVPGAVAVDSTGNLYVSDTGNATIRKGVFTAFASASLLHNVPPANASLAVTLLPLAAGGQWKLPWEQSWHNSGDIVSNLAQDNYTVQFHALPGYLTIATNFLVSVTNGGLTRVTNQYFASVNTSGTGALTVIIGPNSPAGSGWRFIGETLWRAPGDTVTNLLPDTYYVEFEPVAGRAKPASEAIAVAAGSPTFISVNYLLATAAPSGVLLPFPVPTNQIGNITNYPFGFNGQLQSDVGFGSGVAVQADVVLTAAHIVFNDQTLNYVGAAYWYFQNETGVNHPEPQAARGWYVLSGYASERTNDLQSGLYGPDESTPQSRNLDVAALYFLSPVAGGGYGGYLPSDASPNPWLTGSGLKMVTGYPVDGSMFGNASIVPGVMYQTSPQPYALTLATDPGTNQQVYTAPWFFTYPGNSGGPVYAQFNGYYYPAGIYLGTLYNGSQPSASLVRAIDSQVVGMITNAAVLGDSGTNGSGGGVSTIIPSPNTSTAHPGYLLLQLGPPSAVQTGAAWKLAGQSDSFYSVANPSLQAVTTTNILSVQFKTIPGWLPPTNRSVTVVAGYIVTNVATYTVTNPALTVDLVHGLQISGATNTTYQIQSNRILGGGTWVSFQTNTVGPTGTTVITNRPPPGFYRALWLTNSP